jgi:ABC-type nitrate/sulfonate/bicarbonate transport system substrate-binding protein
MLKTARGLVIGIALALTACGGAAAPASNPASASAKPAAPASASTLARTVRFAYATQTATSLPVFIARDTGMFKSRGINADITFSRDGATAIAALVGGDVQFIVVGDPNMTNAVLQGADIEWLAWPAHTVQIAIVGQPSINSLADLKGKTVGVTAAGSTTDLFVQALLRKNGLEPKKDVNVVAIGGSAEAMGAFTSKRVDAGAFAAPFDQQAVAQGGKTLFDFRKSDYTYPQSGVAVKRSLTKSDPGLVSDVIKSYAEAVARFKSDPQLVIQTLMREYKVDDQKLAQDTYDLANQAVDPDVTPRASDEQSLLSLLAVSNPKAASAKPQDFYDDSFAKAAMGK